MQIDAEQVRLEARQPQEGEAVAAAERAPPILDAAAADGDGAGALPPPTPAAPTSSKRSTKPRWATTIARTGRSGRWEGQHHEAVHFRIAATAR